MEYLCWAFTTPNCIQRCEKTSRWYEFLASVSICLWSTANFIFTNSFVFFFSTHFCLSFSVFVCYPPAYFGRTLRSVSTRCLLWATFCCGLWQRFAQHSLRLIYLGFPLVSLLWLCLYCQHRNFVFLPWPKFACFCLKPSFLTRFPRLRFAG